MRCIGLRVSIRGSIFRGGEIIAPPSKSYSHRALILSSLADGSSYITNLSSCDDVKRTMNALRLLGVSIEIRETSIKVEGVSQFSSPSDVIDCGGSASTLRMITPLISLLDIYAVLTGDKSLRSRPIGEVLDALKRLGCRFLHRDGYLPLALHGVRIEELSLSLKASLSSQHVSGFLLSSPLLDSLTLSVMKPIVSKPYVDLTVKLLSSMGVESRVEEDAKSVTYFLKGSPRAGEIEVPGDYSSASFLMVAAAITSREVIVRNLPRGKYPDSEIVTFLEEMGATVEQLNDGYRISSHGSLNSIEVDLTNYPDLFPPLLVAAAVAKGTSILSGIGRLIFKESNRVKAMCMELSKMGASLYVGRDQVKVEGVDKLRGSLVSSWGDHRVEMALAVAALKADGTTTIRDAGYIMKSYPNFYNDLSRLGADLSWGEIV
ncbi:MAG: 3-phosphoshikimate 1-carboxyvinyltransferase [Candidatus Thorarchaeota archaeon]|nr:MAG: 3-phosphoshikimate 1-carboxyvinyltransferase [Candidatus Thorarchaeota archaeon]